MFGTGRGSSSDLAHLLITLVRGWGVPARFATGHVDPDFFEPDDDDEDSEALAQGPRVWAEVLIPGAGWRGFDAAEGLVVNDTYVQVAFGRDADDTLMERSAFIKRGDRVGAEVRNQCFTDRRRKSPELRESVETTDDLILLGHFCWLNCFRRIRNTLLCTNTDTPKELNASEYPLPLKKNLKLARAN